jgi:hypothetical protein
VPLFRSLSYWRRRQRERMDITLGVCHQQRKAILDCGSYETGRLPPGTRQLQLFLLPQWHHHLLWAEETLLPSDNLLHPGMRLLLGIEVLVL